MDTGFNNDPQKERETWEHSAKVGCTIYISQESHQALFGMSKGTYQPRARSESNLEGRLNIWGLALPPTSS